ncbi:cobalamin biosynthesis protein CbiX [Kitasatospora sp. NPDC048722]|uniref:cobalamin biosynthesis protein CbiX n=1 Tax=Kitasatospora sp. NPDC048722 TaxID=3155639 RepID=UPI00340401B4
MTADRRAATVVLAGGHESGHAHDLAPLVEREPAIHAAAAPGRDLDAAVRSALAATGGPVCVVPMTLGRDPRLVADSARALHWLAAGEARGRLALTAPFGAAEHLVGWLRAAAGAAPDPDGAILVTAPAAGPFQDAELFRIARLVRQYGHHRLVEVALAGGDPGPAEGAERCRLLGARTVTAVPASFGRAVTPRAPAGVRDGGPLLRPSAIAGVVAARTAAALHLLGRGEDGVAAGLDAEHGHGYAHSHGPGGAHGHGPGGAHGHGPGAGHGHAPGHGHAHVHTHH